MLRSLYDLKSLTIFTYCLHIACCSELLEILEQTTPFAIYRHSFYRQNASICLCKIKPVGRPTLLFHVQIMHCRLQHISWMYAIPTCILLQFVSHLFTHHHTIHMKLFLLQYISLRSLETGCVTNVHGISIKKIQLFSWSWVSTSACICG